MKVSVNRLVCCNYGVCVENVPEVFSFGTDNTLCIATDIPVALHEKVRFACELCPSMALECDD